MQTPLLRIRRFFREQRVLSLSLAIAIFAAIGGAFALHHDAYSPLFATSLAPEQVAEVSGTLAAWNVPFVAGLDNVRVDGGVRNATLLRLALAGVPRAHVATSSEALAKASALTPQSVLDAEKLEGLSGDIALGLRGLAGVRDARVIIAPAKPAMFADEAAHEASASVRLTLEPGAILAPAALEGVRAFVASSVAGLEPKRVAILDDRGIALTQTSQVKSDGTDPQSALQSALDAAFGAGSTIVRVHADYDPLARQVHEMRRQPLGLHPVVSTSLEERYAGERKNYSKRNATEDRGSDLRDERTDVPAGRLARLSVAVAVDQQRHLDLTKIRALAGATIGYSAERGDSLAVEEVAFSPAPVQAANPAGALGALLAPALPVLGFAAVFAVAIATLGKPSLALVDSLATRARIAGARNVVAGYAPSHVRGALSGEPPHTAAAIISALPAATATAVLELYPPQERAAIVRRMARSATPATPDLESVLHRA